MSVIKPEKMTEKELIEKCRQNKPSAQKTLYERYAPKMMGVCLRYTSDHDSAKDMLQEGFISVFTNFHLFEGKGSLEGWIRRIVINSALQHLRKNVVFTTEADMSEYENEYSTNVSALEELSAKDLMKIINTLPPGFKTVFNLYAIEGYSHKEIGDMLKISEAGSRSQYSRAKKVLQKIISEEFGHE